MIGKLTGHRTIPPIKTTAQTASPDKRTHIRDHHRVILIFFVVVVYQYEFPFISYYLIGYRVRPGVFHVSI